MDKPVEVLYLNELSGDDTIGGLVDDDQKSINFKGLYCKLARWPR